MNTNKETLNLFKSVVIPESSKRFELDEKYISKVCNHTLKSGYLLHPDILKPRSLFSKQSINAIISVVESDILISGEQMNNSFHKSWSKVADTPIEILVIEQIAHYYSTYGMQSVGLFSDDNVFIPTEELLVPGLEDDFEFMVINGISESELVDKVNHLIKSGVALKETTQDILMNLIKEYIDISTLDVDVVKNKEIKTRLCKEYGLVPKNSIEFLRTVVFELTGSTLLIKNQDTYDKIAESAIGNGSLKSQLNNNIIKEMFDKYEKLYSLIELSKSFNRFKPIYLAIKKRIPALKSTINKISKLSKVHHEPICNDYLNDITAILKSGVAVDQKKLKVELDRVNTFRKIRLLYALNDRMNCGESVTYTVRNGKSFSTKRKIGGKLVHYTPVYHAVYQSIVKDISSKVSGKKVYIPMNVQYALPATEKKFIGNIPVNTTFETKDNMLVGIHWFNDGGTVDLDLSLISIDGEKLGWDGAYRSNDQNILFSGDVTNAPKPKGASELYKVSNKNNGIYLVMVNHYNRHGSSTDVPFKIMVGQGEDGLLKSNYMIDPNDTFGAIPSVMDKKSKILGILDVKDGIVQFHISESGTRSSASSYMSEDKKDAMRYTVNSARMSPLLSDVLIDAGADVHFIKTDEDDEPIDCEIDLDTSTLTKDSILELLI